MSYVAFDGRIGINLRLFALTLPLKIRLRKINGRLLLKREKGTQKEVQCKVVLQKKRRNRIK